MNEQVATEHEPMMVEIFEDNDFQTLYTLGPFTNQVEVLAAGWLGCKRTSLDWRQRPATPEEIEKSIQLDSPSIDVIESKQIQDDKDAYESFQENGKVQINELLRRYLPGGVTIREHEEMAIAFHDSIRDAWEDSEHWIAVNE